MTKKIENTIWMSQSKKDLISESYHWRKYNIFYPKKSIFFYEISKWISVQTAIIYQMLIQYLIV